MSILEGGAVPARKWKSSVYVQKRGQVSADRKLPADGGRLQKWVCASLWLGEEFEIDLLVHMKQSSNIKTIFKDINCVDSCELSWLTK